MRQANLAALDTRSLVAEASVEATVAELELIPDLAAAIPRGTHVYIPSIARVPWKRVVPQVSRLAEAGIVAVPHVAARRVESIEALTVLLGALRDVSCDRVLVIAGGEPVPIGPFPSTISVLRTGAFERHGIKHISVGAHPQGNPAVPEELIWQALQEKNDYARQSSSTFSITTQFSFDPGAVTSWEAEARARGNTIEVAVGVPGLTTIPKLLKYAALCGVNASAGFLKNQSVSVLKLARWDPTHFVEQICRERPVGSLLRNLHFFPFGALENTAGYIMRARAGLATTRSQVPGSVA